MSIGISICTGPGRDRANKREGAIEHLRQFAGLGNAMRKQRDLLHHAALIGQFVQMAKTLAQRVGRVDAGNHQHRNGIGARLPHCGDGVGQARAGDHEGNAGFAGYAGVAIGHEAGALFVAWRDMADRRAGQAAIELDRMNARNAEYGIDAILLEQADEGFADSGHACVLIRAVPGA